MKTFLSIGTGPGIGFATAERFAREGFRVVICARDSEKTLELAERLKGQNHEVHVRQVDASNATEVLSLTAQVESQFGAVDVVHYNAAVIRQASLTDQPIDTFNSDLAVNIGGALAAAQAVYGPMKARGAGSILLTGGFFGISPNPDYLSLSLGKAGIRALALGLFEPAKADGIHVATVTVAAYVKPNSTEAIGIAEAFWKLHSQPVGSWEAESTYSS
ncbi:SDR family oxidoreductase [Pseudomonas putida]|uniref:SDR family NAD(P)-dependent oxidoreductase n=1 Tax=Pseudomonas putida TaxID=303 RepID=A0A8I1JM10_PSEPU|nr:SDR family NAD(P)-dependent oxidoreductase [Pseudomonas putida]MBI6884995.1 SDR family NAD(P)-dependent oxidoreductase [Pseudomonas putida]